MSEKLDRGARRNADGVRRRQGGGTLSAGFVLAMTLAVVIASWHAAAARKTVDVRPRASAAMISCAPAAFSCDGESGPARVVVLAAAKPEQDKKLEAWREEGIRMASELTGIPQEFFRWLQDKGVPVGEFMRFLMPFLEWLDLVEPHNGTTPPAPQRNKAGERTI